MSQEPSSATVESATIILQTVLLTIPLWLGAIRYMITYSNLNEISERSETIMVTSLAGSYFVLLAVVGDMINILQGSFGVGSEILYFLEIFMVFTGVAVLITLEDFTRVSWLETMLHHTATLAMIIGIIKMTGVAYSLYL